MKFLRISLILIFTFSITPSFIYLYKGIAILETTCLQSDCKCQSDVRLTEYKREMPNITFSFVKIASKYFHRSKTIVSVEKCDPISNPNMLLIFVATAPSNINKRKKIRDTWGSAAIYKEIDIRILFFIGAVQNATLQNLIADEAATHRDIVQDWSYVDAYRNLTRKSLSALRWIKANCPNTLYVVKVDDDTLVNPYNVVDFLRSASKSTLNELICLIGYGARPYRDVNSKWYASYEEYNETSYPTYCQGMAYMIPPGLVGKLLDATAAVTLLPMEDVYITGLLRRFLNLSHYGLDDTYASFTGNSLGNLIDKRQKIKTILFLGHCKQMLHYDVFWQLVLESRQQQPRR